MYEKTQNLGVRSTSLYFKEEIVTFLENWYFKMLKQSQRFQMNENKEGILS